MGGLQAIRLYACRTHRDRSSQGSEPVTKFNEPIRYHGTGLNEGDEGSACVVKRPAPGSFCTNYHTLVSSLAIVPVAVRWPLRLAPAGGLRSTYPVLQSSRAARARAVRARAV
eukprot:4293078-Prymnesium_polylepis.1